MSKPLPLPFRRVGPSECVCLVCDWRGSTNALARAAHVRSAKHRAAIAKATGEQP